jgi:hypothetical protein
MRRLSACLLLLAGCQTLQVPAPSPHADGRVQRFAILYTASDWRQGEDDLVDPSGLNATWLQTQRIHTTLRKSGVTNIATLYLDAKPDPAEPQIASAITSASKLHLRQAIAAFAARMDADDHLTIHLSLHGKADGLLYSDLGERLRPADFADMLRPIPPGQRLIIVDACFSGAFVEALELPGSYIATAKADEYGWVERDFSFGQFFFQFANSATPEIAFLQASDAYQAAGEARRAYIETEHGGKGINPEAAAALSFTPVWYRR